MPHIRMQFSNPLLTPLIENLLNGREIEIEYTDVLADGVVKNPGDAAPLALLQVE